MIFVRFCRPFSSLGPAVPRNRRAGEALENIRCAGQRMTLNAARAGVASMLCALSMALTRNECLP